MALDHSFNSFIDTYYAYDFNAAEDSRRVYTTQPLKHDSLSVNMALVGWRAETEKYHTVLTLQAGDSVNINYIGEPQRGRTVKHFQEAYAGAKIGQDLILDVGIYFGHIGNESWVSATNWTYTRSLQLDFVPYYTSGARLSGKHGKNQWQLHLMNGWQTISENNSGKAVGTSYTWSMEKMNVTYNTQFGQELFPGQNTSGLRTYQNLHWEIPGERVSWKMAVDVGTQNVPGEKRALVWGATSSQWQFHVSEKWKVTNRLEYFHDAKGAINQTGVPGNFRVAGASINADYTWLKGLVSRLEIRHLQAADAIYPQDKKLIESDTFIVKSLSYQF